MKNYYKKIGSAANFSRRGIKPFVAMKEMATAMRSVGYDWMDPPAEPTVRQLRNLRECLGEPAHNQSAVR